MMCNTASEKSTVLLSRSIRSSFHSAAGCISSIFFPSFLPVCQIFNFFFFFAIMVELNEMYCHPNKGWEALAGLAPAQGARYDHRNGLSSNFVSSPLDFLLV